MTTPRVSILMPCRDAGAYVDAAVRSIRAQTFSDFELLVVDDGSRDGTLGLLERWGWRDDRVRVYPTPRRGLVPALATGLAEATGELIARMDADDVAYPDRLERQIALLDDSTDLAACGTGVEYFPAEEVRNGALRYERWINGLVTHDDIARDIFVECPVPHPTLMIRRDVLLEIGGYRDLGWPEDYDLVLRLWAAGHRMAKVNEVLLKWRESPDRVSRTDARYDPIEFRRIKIYFLRHTLLTERRPAIVAGTGPVGKTFARELADAGVPIAAFIDVDPRKIGHEIRGAPVLAYDELPAFIRDFTAAGEEGNGAAIAKAGESGGPGPHPKDSPRGRSGSTRRSGVAGRIRRTARRSSRPPLVLAAVGQEGAREEIRETLRGLGLTEMEDFIAVA
jgi:glycosyltransferase involved in cell wall biosynthesis